MAIKKILVLGGGIAGIGSALALASQVETKDIEIEIFELRSKPSTLGGAINLTPNVLRYLADWGVTPHLQKQGCETPRIELFALRTGKPIGMIDYDHVDKYKYRALRVHRWLLLACMLEALNIKTSKAAVFYGKTATKITSTSESISIDFADGSSATGDILLGCDGIHSFARQSYVEPERKPVYTQIAVCNGYADSDVFKSGPPPFATTALFTGHLGSFMMSYHDPKKKKVYAAAVSQREDAGDRDGWKLQAKDQENLNRDIVRRFTGTPNKCIDDFLSQAKEWTLFPVYKLENGGSWSKERCLLLGDAAHGMPPQGESVMLCLEDAVLFAALLAKHPDMPTEELFTLQDKLRRARVTEAYEAAMMGFDTLKDKSVMAGIMMEWFTGVYLWFTKSAKEKSMMFDVRSIAELAAV